MPLLTWSPADDVLCQVGDVWQSRTDAVSGDISALCVPASADSIIEARSIMLYSVGHIKWGHAFQLIS